MKKQIKLDLTNDTLEKFLQIKKKFGFSTNAEALRFCIAVGYDDIKDDLPDRFQHFNVYENKVTLQDNLLNKLVNIFIVPNKKNGKTYHFHCEECEKDHCKHIRYILYEIPNKKLEGLDLKGYKPK